MSKNAFWVFVLLLVVGAGGWYLWSRGQSKMVKPAIEDKSVTPTVAVSPTPTVPPKTIELVQGDASGQSGTVTFTPAGDSTRVSISMVGKKVTVPQPAHIHTGKCPTPGDVKYPLNNVVDGKSDTVVAVKYEDLFTTLLPLAVNVHKSVEQSSVYVACGDLF